MAFSQQYSAAVEAKQVAAQEAQRASFLVERAIQQRQEKIVQAEGEAQAAKLVNLLSSHLKCPFLHIGIYPSYDPTSKKVGGVQIHIDFAFLCIGNFEYDEGMGSMAQKSIPPLKCGKN